MNGLMLGSMWPGPVFHGGLSNFLRYCSADFAWTMVGASHSFPGRILAVASCWLGIEAGLSWLGPNGDPAVAMTSTATRVCCSTFNFGLAASAAPSPSAIQSGEALFTNVRPFS